MCIAWCYRLAGGAALATSADDGIAPNQSNTAQAAAQVGHRLFAVINFTELFRELCWDGSCLDGSCKNEYRLTTAEAAHRCRHSQPRLPLVVTVIVPSFVQHYSLS